jgi:predicted esterase
MSLNTAILAPFRVGGVVGLSGCAFESLIQKIKDGKDGQFEDKKKNLPLFIYHGHNDPTLMYELADTTYKQLRESGFEKMEFIGEKKMGHTVSMQEIRHIKEFLSRMMP